MPRRKRDEGKPKRGLTAYMLFCQDKRQDLKSQGSDVGFAQTGKLLGEAWKALPEDEKQKYNEAAAKDKIRAQKEMAEYKVEHPEDSDDDKKKKKKQPAKKKRKKDPNAPKKPSSAFFMFSKKNRAQIKTDNPAATFGELGKLVGAAWGALDAEGKKEYQELAEEDKKRYEKENAAYLEKAKTTKKKKSSSEDSSSDSSSSDSSDSSSSDDDSD